MATALQLAESLLPRIPFFPWLKMGLSHVALLPFLLTFGAWPAALVAVLRNVLAWPFAGTPLSSLMVAMIAAIGSLGIVGLILRPLAQIKWLGWLGISCALAVSHNVIQLAVVEILLVDHDGFYFQVAPLLAWSLVSGLVVGSLAKLTSGFWDELFNLSPSNFRTQSEEKLQPQQVASINLSTKPLRQKFILWASLFRIAVILFLPWLYLQVLIIATTVTIALWPRSETTLRQRSKVFLPLKQSWPLFPFIAWLHLSHGEGHLLANGWITEEGLKNFAIHSLRLANLALLGPQLWQFFPHELLKKSTSPYLQGFVQALNELTQIGPRAMQAARHLWPHWKNRKWVEGLRALQNHLRGVS